MTRPVLTVITGPTASGKSALAVEVARRLGTEVISADSRQIYRGIPIVTAVPTAEERQGVRHHLLECLDLDQYYSASRFEEEALDIAMPLLQSRGNAVVCGGSMMYVDALCNGLDDIPTVLPEIRNELMAEWKTRGDEWLRGQLLMLDPLHYGRVDLNNLKRVFHAVEVSVSARRPYSSFTTGEGTQRPFDILKVCLDGDRQTLFGRINRRVELMMEAGLEEEARRVCHLRSLNSLNTVGLKEMFAMFDGLMTRDEAVARIQKNTRVYAKKQLTWHRRDNGLKWLDLADGTMANAGKVIGWLREYQSV